ncbi:hypothetical protein L2E82_32396 [Cichorium intybus]|uniref:Uncharacterized protein n=1 Tax=Cichorium intybus TaxID=13427 RepID=A0ACB9BGN9_CICIN|nr:hypothetical protein L2E82_32396 [Cichorium intybus]
MRHRHFSNSFTRFGIDQQDNNNTPAEHPYFPTGRTVPPENGPFIGQMNHMSRGGVHSGPHHNLEVQVQAFVPTFSHPSITENRCLPPGGHPHYTNYMETGRLNDPTNNRGSLKRKRSGSLNSIYTAGSSSTSSSQIPIEKPTVDSQTVPPYRGSLTIDGQDSSRNVRRRYMEHGITRTHFYQPTPHPPNYSAPLPHYPAPSRHEMNQFHVGGSSSGDSVFSRHPPPSSHGHHASSYGNGWRYSHYAHGATSSTNGMRTPPENFSYRNSRHSSPGGWRGSYRSGRPRLAVERFHSVLDVTESRDGIGHETMMMVDRSSFYGNSRNFSDQYRDLRLDIDNMSYEELLNLEERIGNVNTGLSEGSLSKCLREKIYYSLNQNHEEVSCPICLEEYKDGDNVGRMEKCGHDYHVDCIKKWLLMKKLCPICKTEYSNQEPREG